MFEDDIPAVWNLFRRPPHWVMDSGLADKVATVQVDAGTFADLGAMQKITAQTLGRLGCDGCHSGWDIRFKLQRNFAVNPAGDVLPAQFGF